MYAASLIIRRGPAPSRRTISHELVPHFGSVGFRDSSGILRPSRNLVGFDHRPRNPGLQRAVLELGYHQGKCKARHQEGGAAERNSEKENAELRGDTLSREGLPQPKPNDAT